jgi:predicted solute-binding protein
MRYGPQSGRAELDFCVPSECARRVESGDADLGIVPVVEIQRQGLLAVPGTGIACHGPVRSILLISRVEPSAIRTVAVDSGSRTSVALARIVLRRQYGCDPEVFEMEPMLEPMLASADAALLIGDAALRVDPESLPCTVLDLGGEWCAMTGLPMVFAVWAGKPERVAPLLDAGIEETLRESLQYGLLQMETIADQESRSRRLDRHLVWKYLTRHIVFPIGGPEVEGMERFLQYVMELEAMPV